MQFQSSRRWFGAVVAFCFSLPAHAYLFSIDNFYVERRDAGTGGLIFSFNDPFTDGGPPPSAPNFSTGNPGSYAVTGTPFGVEAGGKLALNGSAAGPFIIGIGLFEGAVLNSNIVPDSSFGLRKGSLLTVAGVFDLTLPLAGEGYGVRLTDATGLSNGDDDARLAIRRRPSGEIAVVFTDTDLTAGTITLVDLHVLTPTEQSSAQIRLALDVDAVGNVTGRYGFSGSVEWIPFASTMTIFNGETFTRGAFFANGPLPLPGTLWLIVLAFAALALVRSTGRRQTSVL